MKLISVTTLAIVLLLLPSPNQAMALPPELQTLMDFKTGSGLGSILEAKDKFIKSLSRENPQFGMVYNHLRKKFGRYLRSFLMGFQEK